MEQIIYNILSWINVIGSIIAIILIVDALIKHKTPEDIRIIAILSLDVCIFLIIWNLIPPDRINIRTWFFKLTSTIMFIIKLLAVRIIKKYNITLK